MFVGKQKEIDINRENKKNGFAVKSTCVEQLHFFKQFQTFTRMLHFGQVRSIGAFTTESEGNGHLDKDTGLPNGISELIYCGVHFVLRTRSAQGPSRGKKVTPALSQGNARHAEEVREATRPCGTCLEV